MIRLLSALTLGVAMFVSVGVAGTQAPLPAPNVAQNQNVVVFQGNETLENFDQLTFTIRGNDVEMLDATNVPIAGNATIVGNRHTFTFANCVYEGELINGTIAGIARFTSGAAAGITWTFNVRMVGN